MAAYRQVRTAISVFPTLTAKRNNGSMIRLAPMLLVSGADEKADPECVYELLKHGTEMQREWCHEKSSYVGLMRKVVLLLAKQHA